MADAGPAPAAADPGPAPAAPAAPPAPPRGNMNLLGINITVPDIRNGDPATITQAAPKASISAQYKWCVISGMGHAHAVTYVDAVIRAQYTQLLSVFGADITQAQRGEARTAAIILGSIRAGAAGAYRLERTDFNPEEVVGSSTTIAVGATPAQTHMDTTPGTAGGRWTLAQAMTRLTPEEEAVVGALVYLGMAVPIMQGISLALSGHHYLPTTKNVFMGMKRQTMQVGGAVVTQWVEQLGDRFDDLAFHKSCHPIMPSTKRRWAKTADMAPKLAASGHGAAAIRLPALPSDAQGGKAAIAVVQKASGVILGMGHTVDIVRGPELIRAVEVAEEGRAELDAVAAVKAWMAASASQIAFCAGIVQSLSEMAGTGRETTLAAYSIKKLMSEKAADVSRGLTYSRAHSTRMRDQALSGNFPDPALHL